MAITEQDADAIDIFLGIFFNKDVSEWKCLLAEIKDENIKRVIRISLMQVYKERKECSQK